VLFALDATGGTGDWPSNVTVTRHRIKPTADAFRLLPASTIKETFVHKR
jgi:hypothetical protein